MYSTFPPWTLKVPFTELGIKEGNSHRCSREMEKYIKNHGKTKLLLVTREIRVTESAGPAHQLQGSRAPLFPVF